MKQLSLSTGAIQNENNFRERRRELQPYLDFFSRQLFEIIKYMPAPKRILNLKTGGWTLIHDEQWTALIEKIKKQQREFLEMTFPEFYKKEE